MRRLSKLEKRGQDIAKRVLKWRGQGLSYREIAKKVKSRFGLEVTHMTVKNFLDSYSQNLGEYASGYQEISARARQEFLDTVEQMKLANAKLWDYVRKIEAQNELSSTEVRALVQILREVRKQIELQERLLGTIATGTVNIERMNVIELSLHITKILKTLEKRRYIKILKMPKGAIV